MNDRNLYHACTKYLNNISKYTKYNNCIICISNNDKYVVKNNLNNMYGLTNYLNSRGFNYIPNIIYHDNDNYIYKYINDINYPENQKASDLIKLDAILHNKTVYFENITQDEIKEIYENIKDKIESTYNYYDELINVIENEVYPSPSFYLLERNISSIFSCLNFCKINLEEWYKMISEKKEVRKVLLHNNLDVKHLVKNDDITLISWDKAVFNLPIYDFIKLYKKSFNKYNFTELYKEYNKLFKLNKEEELLLFINLFLPDKIIFTNNEMTNTINVSNLCNYLYITDKLFMENKHENTKKENNKINKE